MSSINAKAKSDFFKFAEKTKLKIQDFSRQILLEVGYRLVYRSAVGDPTLWHPPYWPKDYIPGHFINNWQIGIDAKPTGIIDGVDASGTGSYERLSHLGRWVVGHTYYFVNNLPYASLLESGMWSDQVPPGGMVKLTTGEFQSIAKEIERRYK